MKRWFATFSYLLLCLVVSACAAREESAALVCQPPDQEPKCSALVAANAINEEIKTSHEQLSYLTSNESKYWFKKANVQWDSYAQMTCAYEASAVEDEKKVIATNLCFAHLEKERIGQLQEYLKCRTDNCPK